MRCALVVEGLLRSTRAPFSPASSGAYQTFRYTSSYWTTGWSSGQAIGQDPSQYAAYTAGYATGNAPSEALFQPYNNLPGTAVRLTMTAVSSGGSFNGVGTGANLDINLGSFSSLLNLFSTPATIRSSQQSGYPAQVGLPARGEWRRFYQPRGPSLPGFAVVGERGCLRDAQLLRGLHAAALDKHCRVVQRSPRRRGYGGELSAAGSQRW